MIELRHKRKWMGRLTTAVWGCALLSSLPGCAAVQAFRECGRQGCAGDAAITAQVQRLFQEHPSIEAPNLIDVQTIHGVVYLYGVVDTDMEKSLAESVAHEVPGVTRVVDAIGINNQGK
jgi:osmotically-inducible protein OsmY